MRSATIAVILFVLAALPAQVRAQRSAQRDAEFLRSKPAVNDLMPQLTVSRPDGQPFDTASLRGQYSVLTFGCLT